MNIKDLPEVKLLSDVVDRIDRMDRVVQIQLKELLEGRAHDFKVLGVSGGYSTTLKINRGPIDMDGCYIGEEMIQATIPLLANKKQQVLARLKDLGVQFPASIKAKPLTDEDF